MGRVVLYAWVGVMICGFRLDCFLSGPEIDDWLGWVGVGAFGGGFLSEAVLFLVVVGVGACKTGLRFIFVALMPLLPAAMGCEYSPELIATDASQSFWKLVLHRTPKKHVPDLLHSMC